MTSDVRKGAIEFLQRVERYLIDGVTTSERDSSIPEQVERIIAKAKREGGQKHLHLPEAAFLNTWLPPAIHAALVDFNCPNCKGALLAESYKGLTEFASGTAARPLPFPFEKGLHVRPEDIYARWNGPPSKAFVQPCPDFALRQPYTVVFEGKFFQRGSLDIAQQQLVEAVHETLFYLGVPAVTTATREWNYDYACLVAYDGSHDQTLVRAWNALSKLHDRFWNDANLHVIIVGATQVEGKHFSDYQAIFKELGFTAYESHRVLRHPKLKQSVYFNRDRTGRVWFAVYVKDRAAFKETLWDVIPPPQKKDERPGLLTVAPKPGKEEEAIQSLI